MIAQAIKEDILMPKKMLLIYDNWPGGLDFKLKCFFFLSVINLWELGQSTLIRLLLVDGEIGPPNKSILGDPL